MPYVPFECVLINPGDIDSYLPTLKNALLFYDKINMVPQSDVAYVMGSGVPGCLNEASLNTIAEYKKIFNIKKKYYTKKVKQRKMDPYTAMSKFKEYMDQQNETVIDNNFDFKVLMEQSIKDAEEPWEKAKSIKNEVKALIGEGLVNYPTGDDPRKIANDTSEAFIWGVKYAIDNAKEKLFGGSIKQMPDKEEIAYRLWAATAESMVSLYSCPLLSSKVDFLERLKTKLPSLEISDDQIAGLGIEKWKYQHLTLSIQRETIPDLKNITIEDVLELRHLTQDLIEPYRRQMASISKNLRATPWDKNFGQEAKIIILTKIKPLLDEAKNAFIKHPPISKILRKAYQGFKEGWDSISIAADIFPGTEPFLISACVGAGIYEGIGEYFSGTTDDINNNGMVFLLKAETIVNSKT